MTIKTDLQREVSIARRKLRNRRYYVKRRKEANKRVKKLSCESKKYRDHTASMVKSLMNFNPFTDKVDFL